MSMRKCNTCLKTFSSSNYYRHIHRKNKCVNPDELSTICKDCDTEYSSLSNLKRHQKKCIKYINNVTNSHNTTNNSNNTNNTTNNTTNNKNSHNTTNITNNINNNVALVSFGKEAIRGYPASDMLNIFRKGHDSIMALMKYTHFNVDKPEYHNIYIKSKKDKTIRLFRNNEWITIPIGDELHDLVDRYLNHIDNELELRLEDPSFGKKLGEDMIKILREYCIMLNDKKRNEESLKNLRHQAYIMLCDYKHLPQQYDKPLFR